MKNCIALSNKDFLARDEKSTAAEEEHQKLCFFANLMKTPETVEKKTKFIIDTWDSEAMRQFFGKCKEESMSVNS